LLLVDDERFMRNTLGPALSRLGYQVDLAETKHDALARLTTPTIRYDLVLCDLYLPDGTGLEILAEHRKLKHQTPFILMTAYDSPPLEDLLGSDSTPPLLFKPFRIQDLVTIIESETGREGNARAGLDPTVPETINQPGAELPPSPTPETEKNPHPAETRTGLSVLMVDDSALIRKRLWALLTEIPGVEIVGQADTLAQAVSALRQLKPDAITLDLQLPDGNGLNLLRLIQREHLPTSVIVLTSYPAPQYDQRARAAGAYAFLNKASDFRKVKDPIQALLLNRRNRQGCTA
jgi:CheY-like chemotaxis protein